MRKLTKISLLEKVLDILPFYLISRALFFLIIFLVGYAGYEVVPSREGGLFHVFPNPGSFFEKLKRILLSADASWYMEIARYGYPENLGNGEPRHWVFFPAFPMVVAFFSLFTGSYLGSAIIINAIFFFLALFFLRLFLDDCMDRDSIKFVIACVCLYPVSYFFSTPHSESLFFFLLILAFYLIKYEYLSILIALIFGFMLCTRPTGLLLVPALFFYMRERGHSFIKISLVNAGAIFILFLYFAYLYQLTGDPLIWLNNQKAWGRGDGFMSLILSEFKIFSAWSFDLMHVLALVFCLISALFFVSKKEISCFFMIIVPIVVCLKTGTLLSLSRIIMPIFPLFIYLAYVFKSPSSRLNVLIVLSALFSLMSFMYALHVSFAMT